MDAFGGVIVQSGDGRLFVASNDAVGDVGVTAEVRRNGMALPPIRTTLGRLAADICAASSLAGDMATLVQDFARRVPHDALVSNITAPHETFTPPSDSVVCFIAGTSITTSNGPVAVEALRVGDLVATRSHRFQPVRWANTVRVTRPMLQAMPNLRPIRIRAGALGGGTPTRDLLVSPQHRVQVPSAIADDMFAAADVLIAAKHLVGVSGIEVAEDVAEVTYCHVLCNDHEIAHSDDLAIAATEGSVARQPAAPQTQRAMFELFPQLADPAFTRAKDRAERSDARRTGAW